MVQELIETFEKLKQYSYFIDMGKDGLMLIEFKNENFYHLAGLHKINLSVYFPKNCISKDKQYKYIKSHADKFEKVLRNKMNENNLLKQRINTFKYIPDIFDEYGVILYSLHDKKNPMSLYNGDFGLMKIYQQTFCDNDIKQIYCLLGLKNHVASEKRYACVPQSWMADTRPNSLVQYRKPLYIKSISKLPANTPFDDLKTYTG